MHNHMETPWEMICLQQNGIYFWKQYTMHTLQSYYIYNGLITKSVQSES